VKALESSIAVDPSLVILDLSAKDSADAIRQLGERMVAGGYVRDTYVAAVLSREETFPTGLEFPLCGVALPHGEPDGVAKAAVAIGRCSKPVAFRCMDDNSKTVPVTLIAMLAVSQPESHLDVIGRLIGIFSDEGCCRDVLDIDNADEIAGLIDKRINVREAVS